MRSTRIITTILLSLLALASCSRDPNVVKRRYLESGNKYFEKGKYKEAAIMYADALQKDQLWGPAHYKLALTRMKLGQVGTALSEFRKAIERLPKDSPDYWDSVTKVAEIYLAAGADPRNASGLDEVESFCKQMLARDANSYDGHRLMGDLLYVRAQLAAARAGKEQSQEFLKQAAEQYNLADHAKPGQPALMMQLARVAAVAGDYPTSEAIFRQVIEKDKNYVIAYSELYRLVMYQNNNKAGEQVLKLAFQNNPKAYAFLTALALHYAMERRRDDMVGVLQQIKSHAKEFPQAYLVVGDFYLRQGETDAAVREYREGIVKDSKQKSVYQSRIIETLLHEGKRSEAADLNAQILKENPEDNDAKQREASLLLDKGEVARALTELQAVVTRDPNNPVAHFNLGRAHVARQEWAQAQQQFEKSLELRPDYLQARVSLAQLQVTRGDYEAAIKTSQQILQVDKNSALARLIQSAALMGEKKFAESREILQEMLKASANNPDVLFQMGVVNLAEGKYKESEAAFQKTYQLNPANPRGLMGLVEAYMAQNRADEALQLLQAELAKTPTRMDLKVALGNAAVRAGRFDVAIQYFRSVLDGLDKDSKVRGDIYFRLGETYRRKGDYASAVSSLQEARKTLPDNIGVLSTLGLVLDQSGRWSEAKQVYDATLKIQPNSAATLNNNAFLMAEHGGDLNQALTMAQRATQLEPNLPEIRDTLGWIYLKKNLSDDALDIFKKLVVEKPAASTYRFHLGMALNQKGDKPAAKMALTEALKYNPSAGEKQRIQELLSRL